MEAQENKIKLDEWVDYFVVNSEYEHNLVLSNLKEIGQPVLYVDNHSKIFDWKYVLFDHAIGRWHIEKELTYFHKRQLSNDLSCIVLDNSEKRPNTPIDNLRIV